MIEHLPPGSPWHRTHTGPWGEHERLLHQVESRLRDLLAVEHTALAALAAGFHVQGGVHPPEPVYMRIPPPPGDDDEDVSGEQDAAMAEFERFFRDG